MSWSQAGTPLPPRRHRAQRRRQRAHAKTSGLSLFQAALYLCTGSTLRHAQPPVRAKDEFGASMEEAVRGWDLSEPENDIISSFWLPGDSLAPPCQSDMEVVGEILKFANPGPSSVLFDLGCGDGRICILASKLFGCKSVGCEIEDVLVEKFRQNVARTKTDELVTIVQGDLRSLDLAAATIIVIYLLPESICEIEPVLVEALQRGCVIVCNSWGLKSVEPVAVLDVGPYKNVKLLKYDGVGAAAGGLEK